MKIIGKLRIAEDTFEFFCLNDDGWYSSMMVRNVFGAIDMSHRLPSMTREEFVQLAGNKLA